MILCSQKIMSGHTIMKLNSSHYRRNKEMKKIHRWNDWKFFNCNKKIENFFGKNKKSGMIIMCTPNLIQNKKYMIISIMNKRKMVQLQLSCYSRIGKIIINKIINKINDIIRHIRRSPKSEYKVVHINRLTKFKIEMRWDEMRKKLKHFLFKKKIQNARVILYWIIL